MERVYACSMRQSSFTAKSHAYIGRVRGGLSVQEVFCCAKRSRREGRLAGPSSLTEKNEEERMIVLGGDLVSGIHTEVRRELLMCSIFSPRP